MLDKKDIQQIGSVMDEKLDRKFKEYDVKLDRKLKENNKNLVTKEDVKVALEDNNKGLLVQVAIEVGKVIEQNITPILDEHSAQFDAVERRIGKLDHDFRDYMDKKFDDMKGDIAAVVKGDRDRDTTFKEKMVEIVRRNRLADEPEIALLTELIR